MLTGHVKLFAKLCGTFRSLLFGGFHHGVALFYFSGMRCPVIGKSCIKHRFLSLKSADTAFGCSLGTAGFSTQFGYLTRMCCLSFGFGK